MLEDVLAVFTECLEAGFGCCYCDRKLVLKDAPPYIRVPSLDHRRSLDSGGTHAKGNLCVCCCGCNLAKGTAEARTYEWVAETLCISDPVNFDIWLTEIARGKVANKLDRRDAAKPEAFHPPDKDERVEEDRLEDGHYS